MGLGRCVLPGLCKIAPHEVGLRILLVQQIVLCDEACNSPRQLCLLLGRRIVIAKEAEQAIFSYCKSA